MVLELNTNDLKYAAPVSYLFFKFPYNQISKMFSVLF